MPLSEACWAAPRRKLCPEYFCQFGMLSLLRRFLNMETKELWSQEPRSLKSGAEGGCGSYLNRFLRAVTGQHGPLDAARIMSTPRCSVSFLLRFRRRTA